jgi:hypothetical protein
MICQQELDKQVRYVLKLLRLDPVEVLADVKQQALVKFYVCQRWPRERGTLTFVPSHH